MPHRSVTSSNHSGPSGAGSLGTAGAVGEPDPQPASAKVKRRIIAKARIDIGCSLLIKKNLLRRLQVFLVELPDGPEQAAGDQIEVTGVADRLVVVAQRCGEDFGLPVVRVRPHA